MITFYYDISNSSCRQANRWFVEHKIKINKKRVEHISRRDLIHSLSLSNNGFPDILKCTSRASMDLLKQVKSVENMAFSEGVDYILKHPEVLKTPIILDRNKLVVGYNSENMRIFLSRRYRSVELL